MRVLLAELRHLGRNDGPAVALGGVAGEVLLVIILSRVERRRGRDLGHQRAIPYPGRVELTDDLLRDRLLLRAVIEDHRTVLRADIVALAVERSWVVDREEDLQNLTQTDDGRIERHLYDFRVPGAAAAHLLVGWILDRAAGITGHDIGHAVDFIEDGLYTPETAAAQRGDLTAGLDRWCIHAEFSPC